MAINTGGFQVGVMPQYTPVNPSLVAFNPAGFSDGMLKAYQVSNALEELKASKAKQAELAATRASRILEANSVSGSNTARALAETPMHEKRTGYEAERIGFESRLLMPKFDFELSDLEYKKQRADANKTLLPAVIDTEKATTKAVGDRAKAEAVFVAPEALARATAADLQRTTANNAIGLSDQKNKLDGMKVSDEIANFNALAAIKNRLALRAEEMFDAKLDSEKAEAQYRRDMGDAANLKGLTAAKNEVAGLQKYLDSLMKTKLMSPDGDLVVSPIEYAQKFFPSGYQIRKDSDGQPTMTGKADTQWKPKLFSPFGSEDRQMDPNAREILVDIINTRELIKERNGMIRRLEQAQAPEAQPDTQPQPLQGGAPKAPPASEPLTGPPVGTIKSLPDGSKVLRTVGGKNGMDKWVKVQ